MRFKALFRHIAVLFLSLQIEVFEQRLEVRLMLLKKESTGFVPRNFDCQADPV